MKTSKLDSFRDAALANTHAVTGGSHNTTGAPAKGNHGKGNGLDGRPPGWVHNGKVENIPDAR